MEPIVESDLVGTAEAARVLGVVPDRVRQLAREGHLKFITIPGGQRLFAVQDVEKLRRQREAKSVK